MVRQKNKLIAPGRVLRATLNLRDPERLQRDGRYVERHGAGTRRYRAHHSLQAFLYRALGLTPGYPERTLGDICPAGMSLGHLGVPLTVTRLQQIFVRPVAWPRPSRFGLGRFPVWIDLAPDLPGDSPFKAIYGFPLHAGASGVKVALHQPGDPVDLDRVSPDLDPAHVAVLRGYLADRLPDLGAGEVVAGKICLYTNAPDHDFVLGPVPGLPGAHFASACSSHGFKFSIPVGKVLVELAKGDAGSRDLARFAPDRFTRAATG